MGQFQRLKSTIAGLTISEARSFEKLLGKPNSSLRIVYEQIRIDRAVSKLNLLNGVNARKEIVKLNELISRLEWLLLEHLSKWEIIQLSGYSIRARTYFVQLKSILHYDILQYRGLRNDSIEYIEQICRKLQSIESFELLYYALKRKHRHIAQFGSKSEILASYKRLNDIDEVLRYLILFDTFRNKLFDASSKLAFQAQLNVEIIAVVEDVRRRRNLMKYVLIQKNVEFYTGVSNYYKKNYTLALSRFRSAYILNQTRPELYLSSFQTLALVNMALCLLNLGKYESAISVINKYLEEARLRYDLAIGLLLKFKIAWIIQSQNILESVLNPIKEYSKDRYIDNAMRVKLKVALIIFDCLYGDVKSIRVRPWRDLTFTSCRIDDELAVRILQIQLDLMFGLNDDKTIASIESLRKKVDRSSSNSANHGRWKFIVKWLSILGRSSFNFMQVYRNRFDLVYRQSISSDIQWSPDSLEFLPFEHWFKCMAEGKPYTHPLYVKEKKAVDYTKAEARVSLR
jgi:hypothetical protein